VRQLLACVAVDMLRSFSPQIEQHCTKASATVMPAC